MSSTWRANGNTRTQDVGHREEEQRDHRNGDTRLGDITEDEHALDQNGSRAPIAAERRSGVTGRKEAQPAGRWRSREEAAADRSRWPGRSRPERGHGKVEDAPVARREHEREEEDRRRRAVEVNPKP